MACVIEKDEDKNTDYNYFNNNDNNNIEYNTVIPSFPLAQSF